MNTAHNMDCMDYMAGIADRSFDLSVVDPPYFSGPERRGYYGRAISPIKVKRQQYNTMTEWEVPSWPYFEEVKRVSKDYIIWGYNYFDFCHIGPFKTPRLADIPAFLKANAKGWIVWDKVNGASFFNDVELAYTSFDRPSVIFRYMWNGMMQGLSINQGHIMQGNKSLNQTRIHSTEKPVNLYRWVFREYAVPGTKVLDTHLGSGSIRLAALDFDLSIVGIEKCAKMFEKQERRFREHSSQLKLFI
jgi:site-specific DNA-methyltransferase (adenine-specific)